MAHALLKRIENAIRSCLTVRRLRSLLPVFVILSLCFFTPSTALANHTLIVSSDGVILREYTLSDLKALPQSTVQTTTIWADGLQSFQGPSLSSILYDAGATNGQTLELSSLDDFSVKLSSFAVSRVFPIVAILHNGEPMSIRNHGPYRIIYPYDDDASLKNEIVYARSVKMLAKINVLE